MAEYDKTEHALEVFDSLCSRFDENGWKYQADGERLILTTNFSGEDLPMSYTIAVDTDRQLIRMFSKIPVSVPHEKMIEMAVAVCAVTNVLLDGSFDYDMEKGSIYFRITATFMGTDIGDGVFDHLVNYSNYAVDKYNDKFFALAKGMMNINDFVQQIN